MCHHTSRYETVQHRAAHLDDLLVVTRVVRTCGAMMTPPPTAEDDLASVGSWLENNCTIVENWLKQHASVELRQRVHQATRIAENDVIAVEDVPSTISPAQPAAATAKLPTFKRTSITSDLFQLWLAASPANNDQHLQNVRPLRDLESMEESELFMELIRDVANELDIDVLCHKILKNVSILTHADRGSLFLARGPPNERYLVAKLFDVRHDTSLDEAIKLARSEEIRIPFGVGIAGTVAKSKTLINIKDAYKVSIFMLTC